MARRSTDRAQTSSTSSTSSDESSDDDVAPPPTNNRRAARLPGGGARGAPSPIISRRRGRLSASRQSVPSSRNVRGGRGTAARRGRQGPIFGGRQQQMVAAARRGMAGAAGHAYRIGQRTTADDSQRTIELSDDEDEEDEDDEGDDVFDTSEEEEEDDEMGADDSLRDFVVHDITHGDDFDDSDDDAPSDDVDSFDEDDDGDDDVTGPHDHPANPLEETFSEEMAEFERMQQRERQAAARSEQKRLRQLEKQMEKDNKENKNAPPTDMFGACSVCMADEVVHPVGCVYCSNFIGCRRCATKWYIESKRNNDGKFANCPLCRAEWPGSIPEVADMLDLVLKNG